MFPTNETTGFGSLTCPIGIGVTRNSWYGNIIYLASTPKDIFRGDSENKIHKHEEGYFITIVCDSASAKRAQFANSTVSETQTVEEGKTGGWAGYFLFIDRKKSPAHPDGFTAEDFSDLYIGIGTRTRKDLADRFFGPFLATISKAPDGKLLVKSNPDWQADWEE